MKTSVLDRFLRYVTYDTQSAADSPTTPSTAKQLVLLDVLVEELRALGLTDAVRDEQAIVTATLPANTGKPGVPVIGFVAHVDTSPEMSGEGVKPIVWRDWDGRDIALPDEPSAVIRVAEHPALAGKRGESIVTASGRTLLGADDKSGVAVAMAALEWLLAHPEVKHGAVRVAFTPDEEIGRGVRRFDVRRFGARCAYTLDGEGLGRIDSETFSADSMRVVFQGFNTHPGLATGQMVNSLKVAADFVNRLPKDGLAPETTRGREGFVHPNFMDTSVDRTSVEFIIRDFETAQLAVHEQCLERLARETVADWPGSSVSFEVVPAYRNMRDILAGHPEVVEYAREAIRRAGIEVQEAVIRGGTDGSVLSALGLPTPNLFTGQHAFHSRLEWISVEDMEKSVEVVVNLARIWEERA